MGVAHEGGDADEGARAVGVPALEMTKWFDTNYHYLVPEFGAATAFRLASAKPFDEFTEALALCVRTKPVLLGPVSFLLLGKGAAEEKPGFDPLTLLDRLLPVYVETLERLAALGASWVQLDEPTLVRDLTPDQRAAFTRAYAHLRAAAPTSLRLLVATYFGALGENLPTALALPVEALHYDATRGSDAEVMTLAEGLRPEQILSLGVVDGRNVWRNDFGRSLALLETAAARLGRPSPFRRPILFAPARAAEPGGRDRPGPGAPGLAGLCRGEARRDSGPRPGFTGRERGRRTRRQQSEPRRPTGERPHPPSGRQGARGRR